MTYDVLIIGGGPGGIYTAWELLNKRPDLKLALFESGHTLERRRCPIDGVKVKSCVHCPTCAIMNGFGGAGAFSDGKYNITNRVRRHPPRAHRQEEGAGADGVCGSASTWTTAGRAPSSTPLATPASKSCVWRTTCTCWTPPCGIWERTSTMWCWSTSMPG